jgi:hypothetical protein
MNHHFTVKKSHALLAIIVPTGVFAITSLYGLYGLLVLKDGSWYGALFVLGLVLFLDHGVALSHPTSVIINDTSLEFHAFNRHHTFNLEEITRINVRKVSRGRRLYLRLNDASLLKGRYWLHLDHMSDAQGCLEFFEKLMDVRHPKFRNMEAHSFKRVK